MCRNARGSVYISLGSHTMLAREPASQLELGLTSKSLSSAVRQGRTAKRARKLETAGLFAGIGGFELGLARADHRARVFCEIDPAAQAVLKHQFAKIPIVSDVTKIGELCEAIPREVELLTAGFPCQDLSQAGSSAGIDGARSGLVSHVFKLLQRRPVPWVIIENVPFMLRLDKGRAMKRIVSKLERLGYRWAYRVIDSSAFGVPQRRERVFLVASLDEDPRGVLLADESCGSVQPSSIGTLAHGFYWTEGNRGLGWAVDSVPTLKGGSSVGIPSPPAILMPDLSVITPDIRDAERLQGFPDGWTEAALEVAKRGVRWRLVGNAVTVSVAEWLGRRLAVPAEYDAGCDRPFKLGAPWPTAAWFDGVHRGIAAVSKWPLCQPRERLHRFLRYDGAPLSARASEGFLSRAMASNLRFADGFLEAVEGHYQRIAKGWPRT